MPDVTIVYWRDIPAQVIVGKGRNSAKIQLHQRFEKAIDAAAMRSNTADTDSYLAQWRKTKPYCVEGDTTDIAIKEAARLEAAYDRARLAELIKNHGREH